MRVLVGVRRGAVPHRRPEQATPVVEMVRDVDAEGPGLHVHLADVIDAAAAQTLEDARIALGGGDAFHGLRPQQRGLLAGLRIPAAHGAIKADDALDQQPLGAIPDGDACGAVDRVARLPRAQYVLGWLVEQREDEQVVLIQPLLAAHDLDRGGELVGTERVERVRRHARSMATVGAARQRRARKRSPGGPPRSTGCGRRRR